MNPQQYVDRWMLKLSMHGLLYKKKLTMKEAEEYLRKYKALYPQMFGNYDFTLFMPRRFNTPAYTLVDRWCRKHTNKFTWTATICMDRNVTNMLEVKVKL